MARVLASEIDEALKEQEDIIEMSEGGEESLDDYMARMEWQTYQRELQSDSLEWQI